MIKNIALVTVAIITACACASTNAQPPDCPPKGQSILTIGQYHLDFNEKKPICVTVPGSFTITIHNNQNPSVPISEGSVTIAAKSSDGLVIDGKNGVDINKIEVELSGDLEPGIDVYDFWIRVDGLGVLDPKVRVVDNDTMMLLKSEAFSSSLESLDISPELAAEFIEAQLKGQQKAE